MVSRAALKCGNRLIAAYLHTKGTLENILEGFFPPRRKFFLAEFAELFRSARTSYRAFDFRPSTRPPATIFPEFIDELYHCRQASGTPQTLYFLKADDVSYPNSDENTNTETNTGTNTNTETNKGKTNDSYDVIYF